MSDNTPSAQLPFGYLLLLGLTTCTSVAFAALWYNERAKVQQPPQQRMEDRIISLLESKKTPAALQLSASGQSPHEQSEPVAPAAQLQQSQTVAVAAPAVTSPAETAPASEPQPQPANKPTETVKADNAKQPAATAEQTDGLDLQLAAGFEATNLAVQHIAAVRLADGSLQKVVAEVPVLYSSKSLRWSNTQLQQAHELLARLKSWQTRQQQLLQDAQTLQQSWQKFVEQSQPSLHLRADSISLPQLKSTGN